MTTTLNLKYYFIVLVFLGCQSHETTQDSNKIFQVSQPSDSLKFYFPESLNKVSRRHHSFDNFAQNWYSSTLYSFKEPILSDKNDSETIYRFLWLRSFHQPICLSLKEFQNEYFLSTKMLDQCPAWYPRIEANFINGMEKLDTLQKADRFARITFSKTIKLTESEWKRFEFLMAKNNFWSLPSLNQEPRSTDGSEWIIEGYKKRNYHFVERQNSQELRAPGEYLISLCNLNLSKDDIY